MVSSPAVTRSEGFRRRWTVAAIVVAAALLLVTWVYLRGPAPAPVVGIPQPVSGVVLVEGGPPPPPGVTFKLRSPDPHAHLVVVGRTAAGVAIHRRLAADARGRFALSLPPGTYVASAFAIQNAPLTEQPHTRFVVRAGTMPRVRIIIYAA